MKTDGQLQKSLQGSTHFIPYHTMKNSSLGITAQVPLENASTINRQEHERAIQMYMKMMEEKDRKIRSAPQLNQSKNEFLEIPEEITGEWQGAKSVLQGLQNLLK